MFAGFAKLRCAFLADHIERAQIIVQSLTNDGLCREAGNGYRAAIVLGHLPYRIEFRRLGAGALARANRDSAAPARLLVVLELFDVRSGNDLDERLFVYQPEGENVADHTDLYLRNLGLFTETED